MEVRMRIRDVEILTGLSRKTIRFYEAKGLLSVDRSDNSYREYDEGVVEQLKLIALLRRAGISLADIQLWQDGVITSGEMLNKRLTELRSEANIALDQVRLCNQLLAGELQDLMSDTRTNSEDDPELDESSDGSGELCLGLDIGTTT
ncbi:MAG: MerR family transcriptional regulator, partial [Clostridia bacterium]|nr:MerR family transcriptional regulator [Clostridia bacterium]